MAQLTDGQLISEAEIIRDETTIAANTATRIGEMFVNSIDSKINIDAISTDTSLGTSDSLVPSQNAVKVYADNIGLQSVLDANNTASSPFNITDGNGTGIYSSTTISVTENVNNNFIELYVEDTEPQLSVINAGINNSIVMNGSSVTYNQGNNNAGELIPTTLTSTHTWNLPDASGTIALVNQSAFTGSKTINGEVYTWQNGVLISII